MDLLLLPARLAVCRLQPEDEIPVWAGSSPFTSITRTAEELSIVCPEERVPQGVRSEPGWRIFQVKGPLDFSLTGVLDSLAQPLADADVPIFVISTFDTDYVMVQAPFVERAVAILSIEGHRVERT